MRDGTLICPCILGRHTPPITVDMPIKIASGSNAVLLKMGRYAARRNNLAEWE
ncbi:Uncharacterised protein [Burkholderia pseudomallei]|nr:Uncharacterised protein [Burkholderia pseudomallei]CAJ4808310.1 Uncharacterised protein [Burkholderia pseudomallei]